MFCKLLLFTLSSFDLCVLSRGRSAVCASVQQAPARALELRWVVRSICLLTWRRCRGPSERVRSAQILPVHRGPHENAVVASVWGPAWGSRPSVRVRDHVAETGLVPWARVLAAQDKPPADHSWDGATSHPGSGALQGVRPPRPLVILEVFRNSFVFFLKAHRLYFTVIFEMCHWIEYSRNEPTDFFFVCEYLMCSQNTENTFSADKSRKAQFLYFLRKSFTLRHITCDLHVIYQCVSCLGV